MPRVSQEELYNDKDVVTQILKLKDTVNDYAGGIIENIDISGNDLVIDWEDGTSISLPLPDPVTGISSVTGNVSGGNLTITFYFSNGTTHSFTCPLSGMASEAYVDGLDAQNVKLTGAQSVAGVKTFTDSPVVPTTPGTTVSAVNQDWAENVAYVDDTVNNLLHKEGTEIITGDKMFAGPVFMKEFNVVNTVRPSPDDVYRAVILQDANGTSLFYFNTRVATDGTRDIMMQIPNNETGNSSEMSCGLILTLAVDGTVTLRVDKTINGVYSSQNILTL